ncbi:MAG: response regulator [Candidatus Peribacteraceae bacterium]|nr:response regulator [Candidatus Peribacteraceae bacterium]
MNHIPTILFAEDDALLRSIYVKKFSLAGYNVVPASDGEEALRQVLQNPPDLLVCDISMPKMDGFQVLAQLPKERPYPVILLTNFDREDYRKKGRELGADDFFVKKDMTIKSLLEMVERLLKK